MTKRYPNNIAYVGFAGPLSGERRAYGQLLTDCIASGGLLSFWPVFGDDKADPAEAENVAHRFIERGVKLVVGHFNSECARAAAAIYRKADIPLLLPASTAPDLGEQKHVVRLAPCDISQAAKIAQWIENKGESHCWIWSDGSVYGDRLKQLLEATLKVPTGPLAENTVAVLLGAHHRVAQAVNRMTKAYGSLPIVCSDDCSVDEFTELVAGVCHDVWVVEPNPSFEQLIRASVESVKKVDRQSLAASQDSETLLTQILAVMKAEHPGCLNAGFRVKQLVV